MSTQPEWESPKSYKFDTQEELSAVVRDEGIAHIVDTADAIADDLFEYHYLGQRDDDDLRAQVKDELIHSEGAPAAFGRWFHFPWNNQLVRFPEENDFYDLRTFRNRNLITHQEQTEQLRNKKIAAIGLSVGSSVVDSSVQTGIGNHYMLFDHDRVSVMNLNRLRAPMSHVGLLKTTSQGRKISELDPYIQQSHFPEGYTPEAENTLRIERPDMIIEAVDDMAAKAHIRNIAADLDIPVVMAGDVGDKSVISIERHDQEEVVPFNGKLSREMFDNLLTGDLTPKDQETALIKLIGLRNLSPRLIESGILRGVETGGLPQLGTTATAGGALATLAIREIFLERPVASKNRVYNPKEVLKMASPTTPRETVNILRKFIQYRKEQG